MRLISQQWIITGFANFMALTALASPPNILFIFSDDHSIQTIGAYESRLQSFLQEHNVTPNLDRLAGEGAVFTRSYCCNSICGPSRAAVLTGKHSSQNGYLVNANNDPFDGSQWTFPKVLQQNGYQTGLIGKWHLKSDPTGFDSWEILPGQGTYYRPAFVSPAGQKVEEGYVTDLVTEKSIDWLEQRDPDRPFLLMCQHKAPHRVWMPPPQYFDYLKEVPVPEPDTLFDDYATRASGAANQQMEIGRHMRLNIDLKVYPEPVADQKKPFGDFARMTPAQRRAWDAAYDPENQAFLKAGLSGRALTSWKYQRYLHDYLRCIKAVDDSVGTLLDYLDTHGLADNTVVIYSSDQGFYMGEHGWFDKRWIYEESLRMPFLIRWPGTVAPGSSFGEMIQNIDYAPTFLDIAGLSAPPEVQGRSFLPILKGKTPTDWRSAVYYHYYEYPRPHQVEPHRGLRTERYTFADYYRVGEQELFDNQTDPQQLHNVAADPQYAGVVRELQAQLKSMETRFDGHPQPAETAGVEVVSAAPLPVGQMIPGRIELENYDEGGEGVAYHDDQVKHGLRAFRPRDFVDVEQTSDVDGKYNVGWTRPGEWLKYTVEVSKTGMYTPRIRAAAARELSLEIEGRPAGSAEFKPLSKIQVPGIGGIKSWKTIAGPAMQLDAGSWELRLVFPRGGVNLNWMEFVPGGELDPAAALPSLLKGKTAEEKVDTVLGLMTFEEKARLCLGGGIGSFKGVPRLGIPDMSCTDGPRGPKHPQGTAFPAGPGQSAAWNPELMRAMSEVWGKEARAPGGRNAVVLLGPAFNILRDPLGGRFFEYYSEDPVLNGSLIVPMVEGVQEQKVAACLKHFVANNRENNRNKYISRMDERTLREIYLPAFRMGVDAGAWTVMTGANGAQIEGRNAQGLLLSDNKFLLTNILKNEWGFKGFVMTDWCGTRSTELAANAGLDVSMPWRPGGNYATHPFGQPLLNVVKAGRVSRELIEDKARRVLRVAAFTGMLDRIPVSAGSAVDRPEHHQAARAIAEESAVLLKNDGLLPLDRGTVKELLVVGPNADKYFCGGMLGGSSWVSAIDEVTALRGIREAAGENVTVSTFDLGDVLGFRPITAADLVPAAGGARGFKAEYRKQRGARPVYTETVDAIDFAWEMRSPSVEKLGMDHYYCTYTAQINPPATGMYTLRLRADDNARLGYRMTYSGAPLAFADINKGGEAFATVEMQKGVPFTVRVDFEEIEGDASLQLAWTMPGDNPDAKKAIADLTAAAEKADAVVFVGGLNHAIDTEGRDRAAMDFPPEQSRVIRQLAAVNPDLAVVLINGSPVELGEWIDEVPAVLESWYNGESAGTAVGRILFGDVNPSGRLPFTWPNTLEETPAHAVGTQTIEEVNYNEGIYVGYRYYDKQGIEPQFPFGFGLSYTTFSYGSLSAQKSADEKYPVIASVEVTNTGTAAGKEVVQIYVSDLESSVDQPVKELAGFAKVQLNPGETKTVEIPLHWTAFQFFDPVSKHWKLEPGDFKIIAARSAADLRKETRIALGE
ncbi:sulfatase-like hydrolase/transferase [Pontiellaceae bacterium B12227]|nr:sulfatase-like hydrolase/transferase [Pontiellaceae bacterium B12227]